MEMSQIWDTDVLMIKAFGDVEFLEDLFTVMLLILIRHKYLLHCKETRVVKAVTSVYVPESAFPQLD